MKKLMFAAFAVAIAGSAFGGAALADPIRVDDPAGTFSDGENTGYVEVDDAGAIRACNENPDTPAGDRLNGYIWINANGEETTPTYGNATIGAGDVDGSAGEHDCP